MKHVNIEIHVDMFYMFESRNELALRFAHTCASVLLKKEANIKNEEDEHGALSS